MKYYTKAEKDAIWESARQFTGLSQTEAETILQLVQAGFPRNIAFAAARVKEGGCKTIAEWDTLCDKALKVAHEQK